MTSSRLEAFSDGCLAIFITIILITFDLPKGDSFSELKGYIPNLVSYAISFTVLGIYWVNHHHLMETVSYVNGKILWINLFWLFSTSFLPFASAWAGNRSFAPHPVCLYGIVMLLSCISFIMLEHAIIHSQKSRGKKERILLENALGSKWKERFSLLLYAAGVVISLFFPRVAMGLYFLVSLIWFIPDKRITRLIEDNE